MPKRLADEEADPVTSEIDDVEDVWEQALSGAYQPLQSPVDDPIFVNINQPPPSPAEKRTRLLAQRISSAPLTSEKRVALRKENFEVWKKSPANIEECLDFVADNRGTLQDYCNLRCIGIRDVHRFFASDAKLAGMLREAVELGALTLVNNSLRMISKTPPNANLMYKSRLMASQILKVAKTRVVGFADDAARIGLAIHSGSAQPPVIQIEFEKALISDAQRFALSAPPDFAAQTSDDETP